MAIEVTPTGQACGATLRGVDLTAPLDPDSVATIRRAWLEHRVLVFRDQPMSSKDLERFTLYFGPFGDDTFFGPIPGHDHIAAIRRDAEEQAPLFAESWHTDWSFQPRPPQGTCLLGIEIPPIGGDTLFADQHRALTSMPAALRERLEGRQAIHSARLPYAPDGMYGDADKAAGRSMDIRASEEARKEQLHPLIRPHPETGEPGIFGCVGYIVGIEGMAQEEALELLLEMLAWQTRDEFRYVHRWDPETLVMWDNRSVLHMATGGYDGHARLLHRTTIGTA